MGGADRPSAESLAADIKTFGTKLINNPNDQEARKHLLKDSGLLHSGGQAYRDAVEKDLRKAGVPSVRDAGSGIGISVDEMFRTGEITVIKNLPGKHDVRFSDGEHKMMQNFREAIIDGPFPDESPEVKAMLGPDDAVCIIDND